MTHAMADAQGETHGTSSGTSNGLGNDADRAAFIAGELGDGAADKAEPERDADEDSDTDLDEDGDESESEESEDDKAETSVDDDDKDLDDDDDDDVKDPELAKRLAKVQRADKHARETRARQFAARDAEFNKAVEQWKPRVEAAEEFEKLKSGARYKAVEIMRSLGVSDDDFEDIARDFYAHSKKGGEDPKNREAVARTKKERERDAEVAELKKWRDDREAADRKAKEDAAVAAQFNEYIDGVAKVATKSEKLVLSKEYLSKSPARARADMQRIANELYNASGSIPNEKDVAKALEKERRQILRDHGIDPKSKSPANANAAIDAVEKKKANGKAPAKPAPKPAANDDKPMTKEDFIKMKFD